jgi:predicted house-cleaning noncanonical NTP pyrophosphatase (MazG superfamily)
MGKRLVRDRALENWVVPGAEHQVRPVHSRIEHGDLLRAKLLEECGEVILADGRDELIKELADVLSVMQAVAAVNGIGWDQVQARQLVRDAQSGGFVAGMVWETSR